MVVGRTFSLLFPDILEVFIKYHVHLVVIIVAILIIVDVAIQ